MFNGQKLQNSLKTYAVKYLSPQLCIRQDFKENNFFSINVVLYNFIVEEMQPY
jgi:hypothetical protein